MSSGRCPECGCTTTGPLMFGEIVCDDPDCAYTMWDQEGEDSE